MYLVLNFLVDMCSGCPYMICWGLVYLAFDDLMGYFHFNDVLVERVIELTLLESGSLFWLICY